jgi:hypothetical protein
MGEGDRTSLEECQLRGRRGNCYTGAAFLLLNNIRRYHAVIRHRQDHLQHRKPLKIKEKLRSFRYGAWWGMVDSNSISHFPQTFL